MLADYRGTLALEEAKLSDQEARIRRENVEPPLSTLDELVAAAIERGGQTPPPAIPIRIYKAPMFRRMTDTKYDDHLTIRAGFPPRLQAIFDATEYL